MIGGGEGEQDKLDVGLVSLQSMDSLHLDDATEDTPPTAVPGRGYFGMSGDPLTAGWIDDDDEVSLHGDTSYADEADVSLHGDLPYRLEDDAEATLLRAKVVVEPAPQPVVIRQMRTIAVEASAEEVVAASRVQWGMVFAVVGGFTVMLTTIVTLLLLLAR